MRAGRRITVAAKPAGRRPGAGAGCNGGTAPDGSEGNPLGPALRRLRPLLRGAVGRPPFPQINPPPYFPQCTGGEGAVILAAWGERVPRPGAPNFRRYSTSFGGSIHEVNRRCPLRCF